jgi:hypothetical protein
MALDGSKANYPKLCRLAPENLAVGQRRLTHVKKGGYSRSRLRACMSALPIGE